MRDLWILISILLLLIVTVSRLLFPKVFLAVYAPAKFFSFKIRDDFGTGLRLLSIEYLHFTFLLASALVFNLLVLNQVGQRESFLPNWIIPKDSIEAVLIWLGLSVVVVFLFLLRYVMIAGFGFLFNIPNSTTRHFQEAQSLNQLFILFLSTVTIITLYSSFTFPILVYQTLVALAVIYFMFRQLNLYIKFLSTGLYSKLFIFSYLCTTEIIPALIGIKLVL